MQFKKGEGRGEQMIGFKHEQDEMGGEVWGWEYRGVLRLE